MSEAVQASIDPFSFDGPDLGDRFPVREALRRAGPVVRVEAPAGGPVWVVTDESLARQVFTDPRMAKDPALAPPHWVGREPSLENAASQHPSLTTTDGQEHLALRRVHAPGFTTRRLRRRADQMAAIAREMLTRFARASHRSGQPADLIGVFTDDFPLIVMFDLLGIPAADLDQARQISEAIGGGGHEETRAGMAAFDELVTTAINASQQHGEDTLTTVLYQRAQAELDRVTDDDMRYMITGMIFGGHRTASAALGFLLAHLLAGHLGAGADEAVIDAFVEETLRLHPPVPVSLWRFTTTEVEIGGCRLPAGAPVLVDIEGVNTDPQRYPDPVSFCPERADPSHLSFGEGPHYCLGAGLYRQMSRIVVQCLRTDFPRARLAVPFAQLQMAADTHTRRLAALPVWLDG